MRKVLMTYCFLSAGSLFAAVSLGKEPKLELVTQIEIASVDGIRGKVSTLGKMIENPLLPVILQEEVISKLSKGCGQPRADGRLAWLIYTDPLALREGNLKLNNADRLCNVAFAFPCVDGPATLCQKNPGASLGADGMVHLPEGDDRSKEEWVKFTADRKYCVFANSSALATQALADFEKRYAATSANTSCFTIEFTKLGVEGLAAFLEDVQRNQKEQFKGLDSSILSAILALQERQQQRQLRQLRKISRLMLDVDITPAGISFGGRAWYQPNMSPNVFSRFCLPTDTFASLPGDVPVFCGLNMLQGDCTVRDNMREDMRILADLIAELSQQVEETAIPKKYRALCKNIIAIAANTVREVPPPGETDWGMFAMGFDATQHPYLVTENQMENASQAVAVSQSFIDQIIASVQQQWPNQKMITKMDSLSIVFDWGEIINVAARETGLENTESNLRAISNAVSTLTMVLGDSKTICRTTASGHRIKSYVASPNVKSLQGPSTADARLRAALPEMKRSNLTLAFYISLYGLLRDNVLPLAVKVAPRGEAMQIKTFLDILPATRPNSAIAVGVWYEQDGSMRFLMRATADEIRNWGAAFNAAMAHE